MTIYCIVSVNDITNEMMGEAVNESEHLRYNLDETKAILKFSTPFPNSMKGYVKYSLEELLPILAGQEWSVVE